MIYKPKPLFKTFLFSLTIFSVISSSQAIKIETREDLTEEDTYNKGTISVGLRIITVNFDNEGPVQRHEISELLLAAVDAPFSDKDIPLRAIYIDFERIQNMNDVNSTKQAIKELYRNSNQIENLLNHFIKASGSRQEEEQVTAYIENKRKKYDRKQQRNEDEEEQNSE